MAKREYVIAWETAVQCISKGISRQIWLAPIPDKHKDEIWERAKKYVAAKKEMESQKELFV